MAAYTADSVRAAYVSLSQFGLEPRTHTVRNIVALQGCPKRRPFGERTRCVMNEVSPKAETIDMEQPRTMERFAMLVVSSCSEHRFICRRQRGAPSLDTIRAQYSKHLILTKSEIVRFAHGEIICSANCDICRFASSEMK